MPKVLVTHYYMKNPPGSVVSVSEAEAKRIVDARGGKIVPEKKVETATEERAEDLETRPGLTKSSGRKVTKSEKR